MSGLDLDRMIAQLLNCEILTEREVKLLCEKAIEILVEESNVQTVAAPVRCPPACVCPPGPKPSPCLGWLLSHLGVTSAATSGWQNPATSTWRLHVRVAPLASEATAQGRQWMFQQMGLNGAWVCMDR